VLRTPKGYTYPWLRTPVLQYQFSKNGKTVLLEHPILYIFLYFFLKRTFLLTLILGFSDNKALYVWCGHHK